MPIVQSGKRISFLFGSRGIILCAKKDNAVVQFTLPEDNKQIFVSKYKLYLPTEEELVQELEKEQKALEPLIKEGEEK